MYAMILDFSNWPRLHCFLLISVQTKELANKRIISQF